MLWSGNTIMELIKIINLEWNHYLVNISILNPQLFLLILRIINSVVDKPTSNNNKKVVKNSALIAAVSRNK